MAGDVILRFDEVTFEHQPKKPLLAKASFSVRAGAKITLMGQNGAGKSTILGLVRGGLRPAEGKISITNNATIGIAEQMIARGDQDLTIEEYFKKSFETAPAGIRSEIAKVMDAVNLSVPLTRKVGGLSGGQQARLLLAYALIQHPDILLLDEPTNNLDQSGIDHLIQFLVMYDQTVIVISHDANFLNCFTEGVIYLDIFTKQVETYVGDYFSVVEEIKARVEREQKKNAQLKKQIIDRKEKANFFSHKGGKMRKLAKKMRDETEKLEADMVDVRQDDRTIRNFQIPAQDISGDLVTIKSLQVIRNHEPMNVAVNKILKKRDRLLVSGPNGIGKSTLLRTLVDSQAEGAKLLEGLRVGYYSQDFATLDYEDSVFESLKEAIVDQLTEQDMRSVAAGFLLTGELLGQQVGELSEGQKGLLSFARLALMRPGLLILDEPTNHINFRHIPVIARALNEYAGSMILVSHMADFVQEIKVNDYLDLGKL